MARLAIKGHSTRGYEVIELLKMLGGESDKIIGGNDSRNYYFINKENKIHYDLTLDNNNYIIFTLEQFEKEFPYKVGDKVKNAKINDIIGIITSIQWDCNEQQIIYTVEWNDTTKFTLPYFAKHLQQYKENSLKEKINMEWNYKNVIIRIENDGCFYFSINDNVTVTDTLNAAKKKIDKALKDYYTFNKSDLDKLYKKLDKRECELIESLINELDIHSSNPYCSIGISNEFLFSITKE